jgi:DNA repair exonuclease SbcCD ATPase subunit
MDKKIKKIAHLADIHIRKLHRFVEYRDVFSRLYKKLEELKPDLIYIGGDVVHGKLDTSPEEIRLLADFFLNLSDISKTVIIPGNHDCNLNNKSREDVLSPVVDLVQQINPNLIYWKESGVYELGGCHFGLLSVFDITKDNKPNLKNLPKAKDIEGKNKIALYHGSVGTFEVDTGLKMSDDFVGVQDFNGYDMVLLGDIHKRQFLNDKETIAYCGSLIQQNFAEAPEHGFLLWDVDKRKSEFIQIENDYGYKTVIVEDGEIKSKMNFVPRFGNLKIKHKNTTVEKLGLIELDLRKKYTEIKSISFEKMDAIENRLNESSTKISIEDIHDLKVQNGLIEKVAKLDNPAIDDKTIQRLFDINEFTNSSIGMKNDLPKNVDWKLKYIEFDNMFSYGKKNKIDFTKLDGVVGVVAPNHSGKSALIDIVAYTIFDTCSRTFRAIEVLNNKSKNFEVKLSLEVNGIDYIIHRTGILKERTKRATGEVRRLCPVAVKFYVEENGELIDLSGAARSNSQYGSGTNEEIRKILGSFDDFILTSLSLQNNGQNFVDKKQAERKKILSQFMGIDLFDKLYDIARDDVSDEKAYLKRIKEKNVFENMGRIEQKLKDLEESKSEVEVTIKPIEKDLDDFKSQIEELKSKLKDVDDIEQLDFRKLISEKESELETQKEALKLEEEYKDNIRPLYNTIYSKLKEYDEETLDHNYKKFQECKEDLSKINSDVTVKENKIKHLETSLEEVKEHEFDENCEYCLKNGQWHIEKTKSLTSEIKHCKLELDKILTNKSHREKDIESFGDIEQDKLKYEDLMEDLKRVEGDAYKTHAKIKELELSVEQIQSTLKKIVKDEQLFLDNASAIAYNRNISQKVDKYTTQVRIGSEILEGHKKELNKIQSDILIQETNKKNLGEEIKDLVEAEQKVADYETYLRLVSSDGIPQLIINDALPIIENEVNAVLDHMMAGFQLGIASEKNSINLYIRYDDQEWPLNLSSGMEKFVSSLALRVGLINASNLPSPNFLVIDEGFGTLDTDNLSNMKGAFEYLKTRFDSVFIISHLDTIKDFMDYLLPINVDENGFSKVVYN